ncbi:hypothetical protein CEXT_671931 [Caerostris extrusa]|uniref:Uncharacterized protein n=1 Tax=Caerostris extrusa TaxID=172846 RepID=A0AAV4WDB9_CAEEX|nr:hypothetical protein CEXT_671931 [Caerostris extrusa]
MKGIVVFRHLSQVRQRLAAMKSSRIRRVPTKVPGVSCDMCLFLFVEEAGFAATNSVLSELQGWRDKLEWMEQAGLRDCSKEFVWMAEVTA